MVKIEELNNQDFLVRLSVDPTFDPSIPNGNFEQYIKFHNMKEFEELDQFSLQAEREGRWDQIYKQISPIFPETLKLISNNDEQTSIVHSPIFQEFLSSVELWDIEYSLPHPAGYGKGIEKATPFIFHLRNSKYVDDFSLEVAEVEYAKFYTSYRVPSLNQGKVHEHLFLNRAALIINTKNDILNFIKNKKNTEKSDFYFVIAPGGKIFRVQQELFEFLAKFKNGYKPKNEKEKNLAKESLKLNVLCSNPEMKDTTKLTALVGK